MHLTWVACMLALAWRPKACLTHTAPYESLAVTSLQCYNDYFDEDHIKKDYIPHISCSWRERLGSTPLALHNENRSPCVVTSREESDGELTVRCLYDASNIGFTIGRKYTFYFHSPLHSKPQHLSANLTQHVRVMTPQNLSVVPLQVGGHKLCWDSPYPSSSPLTSGLRYQVTYGTPGQDWTTVHSNDTALEIKGETLLPGQRYEAKVRAQAGGWQWSQWSPLVAWRTEEKVGPSEFQCVIDSVSMVTCSWKLKREHAQFLNYNLGCYHLSNNTRVECCPSPVMTSDPASDVLEFRCPLCVSDPRELKVELTPAHVSKVFKAEENIQPPPTPSFRVEEKNGDLVLRWAKPGVVPSLPLSYQLRYGPKESDKRKNFTLSGLSLLLPGNTLLPFTRYIAEIRVLVGQSETYAGIPSNWSTPVEWTTDPAAISLAIVLYVAVAIVVVFLFIGMVIILPKCQRRIRDWKLSIPSPTHSKVLSEEIKRKASGWLYVDSEKVKVSMCEFQDPDLISANLLSRLSCSSSKEHLWSSSEEDGDRDSLQLLTYRTSSTTGGRSGVLDSSGMSFNGPYIFCNKELASSSSGASRDLALGDAAPPSPCPSSSSSSSFSSEGFLSPVSNVSFLSSLSEMPGGYVATLQMAVPPGQGGPLDTSKALAVAQDATEDAPVPPSWQCQSEGCPPPPAYTRQPPALHTVVLLPSPGYCSLPNLDLSGWASSPPPPPAPAPAVTGEAPPVSLAQSCPRPPEGEQETPAQERRQESGEPSDESRPYVRLKTDYTSVPSAVRLGSSQSVER